MAQAEFHFDTMGSSILLHFASNADVVKALGGDLSSVCIFFSKYKPRSLDKAKMIKVSAIAWI